jgi:hypothetical protein
MIKISRIKFKACDNIISIYDVLIIYKLRYISDKLILYVDDRDRLNYDQKKVDDMVCILKKFNLKFDCVIKYTHYYNIAWIYIHKLALQQKITLNTNQHNNQYNEQNKDLCDNIKNNIKNNNLELLFKNKNSIKIFLEDYTVMNRYDNMLYNNGWFRELFLELIIDDSENITYCVAATDDPNIFADKIGAMTKINNKITVELVEYLKLTKPTVILDEFIEKLNILKKQENAALNGVKLNELSIDDLCTTDDNNICKIIQLIENI